MSRFIARFFGFFIALGSINCLAIETPKSLEEWKPWVLEKHPDLNCPVLFNSNERDCIWPSELRIDANTNNAKFSQRVEVFKNEWVELPGHAGLWPQEVTDNNVRIPVRDNENIPEVYLNVGVHELKGEIRWSEMPRTLPVPEQTGIIRLTLNGKTITAPALEGNNQLWLTASEKQNATAHQDSFDLRVFRKIDDSIPLRITTTLQIDVSGKEREVQLGQFLLNGFTPVEFSSQLPARIEKDGNLRVQVKSGSWEITLVSQSNTPIKELSFKANSDLWPQQEIWVFSAERQLRSVQISGAQTIDPQQTQLPEDWKSLPAYLVTPETPFTMEELQRGESKSTGNELRLNRDAWLSFNGEKFIFNDQINGNTHASRLETIKPVELTHAQINGQSQLITQLANNPNSGIEIRSRDINVNAVSQLPKSSTIPVTGWNEEFNSASTLLHLPPGWSLLTATGVSSEYGSWVSQWSLWDIFAVLIIVIAIARVTKPIYSLLAAATIILVYQRTGAPVFIWLNLIAVLALAKFVTGKFKSFIQRYTYISFLLLALITLPFAVREARIFVNPQLEHEYFWDWSSSFLFSTSDKKKNITYLEHPDFVPPPSLDFVPDAPVAAPMVSAQVESEEIVVTGVKAKREDRFSSTRTKEESQQRTAGVKIQKSYDPNQQTQTGTAVPNFNINTISLQWDGPVKADETTTLILISPWINRLGHLLSVLLPLGLAAILLQHAALIFDKKLSLPTFNKKAIAGFLPTIIIASVLFSPAEPASAQVHIDPAILKELETRLTQAPKCLPNCAAIESANIAVKQDQLIIELVVHSNDLISLPLPADHEQWWPNQVTVDDKTATLVQTSDQELLVSLPKGRHNISIKSDLQGRDALNLNFPVQLHNVTSSTNGWEISGVPTQEQASQSLQLQRVEQDKNTNKAEHLRADPITPFLIVKRELNLGLEWTLTTTVTRIAPEFGAINIEIPATAGESPLSTQLTPAGKISVHLEANQKEFEWHSSIKQVTPLELKAAQNVSWAEVWSLEVSPIWHAETKGIAPVQMDKHQYLPIWQPWPGESLSIDLIKPKATKGSYVTIDWANITYQPGNRSSLSKLIFNIRTNQGGQYSFKLPQDAQLAKVEIDNAEQTISTTNGILKLPLHPGSQSISLQWKSENGLGFITRSPAFSLEQGSSNQTINIELPGNRWPLFVGGPLMGPSILLWGMLLVISLVSYALGRSQLTPLKSYEWVLLGLGICTLNFTAFVLVALWLIALNQRGKLTRISSALKFKFLQVGLFALSIIALSTLITTLPDGLLSAPDMHVLGNDSYQNNFKWYQDYSDLNFPQAWILSLPLWCYKVVMLIWSLWLAASLLRWIRWSWQQLSHNGLWHADTTIIDKPSAVIAVTDNQIEKS